MRVMVLVKATDDSEKGFMPRARAKRCPNPMPGPNEIEIRSLFKAAELG